jgi:hypothetical protein
LHDIIEMLTHLVDALPGHSLEGLSKIVLLRDLLHCHQHRERWLDLLGS